MSTRKFLQALVLACLLVGNSSAIMPLMITKQNASVPFDPQTQGTLVSWYDASTSAGTTFSGPFVRGIVDSKTGNPFPVTSGSSTGTYSSAIQNGLGAFSWPAGSAYLGDGASLNSYPFTLAVVIRIDNLTSSKCVVGPSLNGGIAFEISGTSGLMSMQSADIAAMPSSTSAVPTTSFHLLVYQVDTGTYAYYLDGVAIGSGTHSVTIANANLRLLVKKDNEDVFEGYLGEAQLYSSILSPTDLSRLHTFIVNKWATP